jgi:hypothetical protein
VPSGGCYPNPQTNPSSSADWVDGRSLLGNNYRLITFDITNLTGTPEYSIAIKIAYTSGGVNNAGDDLLCSPSIAHGAGNCSAGAPNLTDYTLADIECKGQVGQQFCDVADLHSNVGSYIIQ